MNNFEELKKALIDTAARLGIDKYEIFYKTSSEVSTETLKDELSNFALGTSGGICFRCIVDGRMGYASTELMDVEEMRALVSRAATNAKFIDNDDAPIIFAGSKEYGSKTSHDTKLPDVAAMKSLAFDIQKQNYAQGECVTDGTQSAVIAYETETRIINSEGLDLSNKAGMSAAYSVIIINKDGEPAQGMETSLIDNQEKLNTLADSAYKSAISKLGAGDVETGTYNIVISGKQMKNLLSAFWSVFSAKNVRLGTSLLANKIGEKIAADCVTISDDPFDPACPIQTTFDAEGVAVFKKNVVENGVLKTFLYNLAEATRANVESTANAYKAGYADTVGIRPYRFAIEPGNHSLDELFGIVINGIYITETKGLHAGTNAATGDFSIECAGYVIENGKQGRPVKSFTIAGNFYDLLKNITNIGDEMDHGLPSGLNVFASPAVLVQNISVAGK